VFCICSQITDIKARSVIDSIKLLRDARVTTVMHPATYMNKVVFGFADGALELWNVRSRKLVHTFACLKEAFDAAGESKCPAITCIEQSPAADVVAIGFASGDILLVNLKIDKVLFSFAQKGSVTSLGFRTDEAAYTGVMPYLLSSSSSGAVHVWNLGGGEASADEGGSEGSRRGLVCSIDDAHALAVSRLYFLEGEPVFITSSCDNSIKTWIFDQPVGHAPRLLRSREGHLAPPNLIRYYGTGGGGSTNASLRDAADGFSCEIISAGSTGDLRVFNTARESQNKEMSQKNILKKLGLDSRRSRLPPTVGFDFAESRDRDWGNLVTIHKDRGDAYSWRYKHRASTEMVLRQPSWKTNEKMFAADTKIHATSVAVSACGNFCVVGNKGGSVHRYNLQSGLPRGSFPRSAASALMKEGTKKLRERMPGNVLHSHRQIVGMDDGTSATGFLASGLSAAESRRAEAAKVKAKSVATDAYIAHLQSHGHAGSSVTGLFIDAMNEILVSSGDDAQGHLIFWSYDRQDVLGYALVGKPIVQLVGFRDGNFVACVTSDNSIFVYDIITRRLSRKFTGGHTAKITALAFTPDGRRLVSGSLDGCVRVWDMLTARCLAWVTVKVPITSLALAPSGEFLCLTLEGKQGIFMYADRSLFETVHFWKEPTEATPVSVSLAAIDSNVMEAEDAAMDYHENSDGETDDENTDKRVARKTTADQDPSDGEMLPSYKESEEQRCKGSITFSSISRAYWVSLFNMEAIKARNRPIEPPKAPEKAPFFLPTLHRGASAPSFPTPQEYEKLVASKTGQSLDDNKRKLEGGADDAEPSKKGRKSGDSKADDELAAQELASMGVWKDEEGEAEAEGGPWTSSGDWGDDDQPNDEKEEEDEADKAAAHSSSSRLLSSFGNKDSERKIISKRTVLPR
jgi:U3 small nucleolar RNA-associated protein 21